MTHTTPPEIGAQGASQLSPRSLIPANQPSACQPVRNPIEPSNLVATYEAQAEGQRINRRTLVNMIVRCTAATAVAPKIAEASSDHAELFLLEKQIFQEHAAADAIEAERRPLGEILAAERDCLLDEMQAAGIFLGRNAIHRA